MANIVYIATSIDGFIAREDGNIDWLMEIPNPNNSDYGFFEFMKRIDGVFMGRKTFETAMSFDTWIYTKPVFVLSNSLKSLPDRAAGKAELISGELKDVLTLLKKRGINNLYVDGGKTIQSFLKEDLIDEMIITRIPILLGSGIPLFGPDNANLKFRHVKTEVLDDIMVKTHYIRQDY